MNPQDPRQPQQQYQVPNTPHNPFENSRSDFTPGPDRPRIPVKLLTKLFFGLLFVGAVATGTGYGVNSFLQLAEEEQRVYNASLAEEVKELTDEPIYIGGGSDIVETTNAEKIVACPSGYSESGDECKKDEVTIVSAAQKTCPSGYTQSGSGDNVSCSRVEGGTTVTVPATVQLSCQNGYTLDGSDCVKTDTVPYIIVYSCPAGFQKTELTAGKVICSKQETMSGSVRTSCPSGTSPSGSGCVRTIAATANTSVGCPNGYSLISGECSRAASATCPTGYTPNGGNCIATARVSTGWECRSGTPQGSGSSTRCRLVSGNTVSRCPTGYTRYVTGGECIKWVSATYFERCPAGYTTRISVTTCSKTANYQYPCPGATTRGTGSSTRCYVARISSTSYSCPGGYSRSGTSCSQSVALNYACDTGFARNGTGSGTTCTRISITNRDADQQKTCTEGFRDTGKDCAREQRVASQRSVSCASGQRQQGSQCLRQEGGRTVTANPSVAYRCASGFKQVGTGSESKCEKRATVTTNKQTQYQCAEGWLKRVIGTTIDCVRTV